MEGKLLAAERLPEEPESQFVQRIIPGRRGREEIPTGFFPPCVIILLRVSAGDTWVGAAASIKAPASWAAEEGRGVFTPDFNSVENYPTKRSSGGLARCKTAEGNSPKIQLLQKNPAKSAEAQKLKKCKFSVRRFFSKKKNVVFLAPFWTVVSPQRSHGVIGHFLIGPGAKIQLFILFQVVTLHTRRATSFPTCTRRLSMTRPSALYATLRIEGGQFEKRPRNVVDGTFPWPLSGGNSACD